ncbi:unnamed protein product [Adineta steineri]|uniref:Carrier domain-containing protein n=1 Tax=Adineta steineri TaxID=433720 RepID=A0A815P295_9BILA|nr:unnamed protein product [Adineta steineri]CAF4113476.1 unnamed protein product [Adineta steineri]
MMIADVTNFQQVHGLIQRFTKTCYPIRGIIHSAVVAEDRTLGNLTQEQLSLVLPPKVLGAWYLHQVTQLLHAPIHFFIMFSSIRNYLLEVASASYNAGNQFLDVISHYRFSKLNLPALSISLPAVSGAEIFHCHKEMLSTLKVTQGFELMPTGKANSTESSMNKKETIIERNQSAVARLLGAASVDRIVIDRSLVSQGMDSLAGVLLYNWLGQETDIYIPLVDLLQEHSIEKIGTLVYNKLNEKEQKTTSVTKEHDSEFNLINENKVQFSNTSTYTGLENLICLHRSNQNNTSTLFCITQISNNNNDEDLFTFFIDKLSNEKDETSSNDIYALQIPSSLSSSSISTYAQILLHECVVFNHVDLIK